MFVPPFPAKGVSSGQCSVPAGEVGGVGWLRGQSRRDARDDVPGRPAEEAHRWGHLGIRARAVPVLQESFVKRALQGAARASVPSDEPLDCLHPRLCPIVRMGEIR